MSLFKRRPTGRQRSRLTQAQDDLTDDKPGRLAAYRQRRSVSKNYDATGRQPLSQARQHASGLGRFWMQRFGLIVLLIAVVASAINVISLSSSSKIVPLTTSTNQAFLRPLSVYQQAADKNLKSSIWNHNKITVNTGSLSRQLVNEFPELASVSVTLPLLSHQPLVYIEPAQPALILVNSQGPFVIDTTGKALIRASNSGALSQTKLPTLTDQSGIVIRLKRQALPADNVNFIQTVIAQLAAKQYGVSGMTLPAAASELDVQLAGQPYLIKFNLHSANARGQVGTFLATITTLKRQNITPSKYIDVRIDGRAYYQ